MSELFCGDLDNALTRFEVIRVDGVACHGDPRRLSVTVEAAFFSADLAMTVHPDDG